MNTNVTPIATPSAAVATDTAAPAVVTKALDPAIKLAADIIIEAVIKEKKERDNALVLAEQAVQGSWKVCRDTLKEFLLSDKSEGRNDTNVMLDAVVTMGKEDEQAKAAIQYAANLRRAVKLVVKTGKDCPVEVWSYTKRQWQDSDVWAAIKTTTGTKTGQATKATTKKQERQVVEAKAVLAKAGISVGEAAQEAITDKGLSDIVASYNSLPKAFQAEAAKRVLEQLNVMHAKAKQASGGSR